MEKFSLTDLQIGLLEHGVIDFQGEVDDEMYQYVRDCLSWLSVNNSPPICIRFSSGGGSVDAGLVIYDMLRLYPGKTTGLVVGFARSMATVILQACSLRLCTKHSVLFVHSIRYSGSIGLDEFDDRKKLKKIVESARKNQDKLFRIMEGKTGKSKEVIMSWCKKGDRDIEISAEEALKYGLIDAIV